MKIIFDFIVKVLNNESNFSYNLGWLFFIIKTVTHDFDPSVFMIIIIINFHIAQKYQISGKELK